MPLVLLISTGTVKIEASQNPKELYIWALPGFAMMLRWHDSHPR